MIQQVTNTQEDSRRNSAENDGHDNEVREFVPNEITSSNCVGQLEAITTATQMSSQLQVPLLLALSPEGISTAGTAMPPLSV